MGIAAAAVALLLQAAPSPAAPSAAESPVCETAAQAVIFPGTGQTFTLPPDENSACPQLPPVPIRPPAPNIFGSVALPVKSTRLDWRWHQARAATPLDSAAPGAGIVARAQSLGEREKLSLVNSWVNSTLRFTEDDIGDHWASAAETFRSGAGDCEDFAIAKLTLLQEAGLVTDSLFLVIVRDTQRNVDHAVLGARLNGEMLVLDSRTDRILPSSIISDYQPIFSFSGEFAWTHGYARGASSAPGQ